MIRVFLFVSVLLSCLPFLHSATDHNTSMPTCPQSFSCPGPNFVPFEYPFYNGSNMECGLIKVHCTPNGGNLSLGGDSYEIGAKVLSDYAGVTIRNRTFERLVNESSCKALMDNFTSPTPLLYSVSIIPPFITLYKCANAPKNATQMDAYFPLSIYNNNRCKDHDFYYNYSIGDTTVLRDLPPTCQVIQLPVKSPWQNNTQHVLSETNIFSLLSSWFAISFKLSPLCDNCRNKQGRCHTHDGRFECLNATNDDSHVLGPSGAKKGAADIRKPRKKAILMIVVLAGSAFIFIPFLVICIIWCRYKTSPLSYFSSKDKSSTVEDRSLFYGVSVFSCTELEDATQNFNPSKELGTGGFGAVYYGKLQDGREVAVKRLYEHNYRRAQQFVNEVRILTGLHHPNLVVLYGCTSRHSHELLLVYEYISNGTLADHLHGERANPSLLTWPLRMNIAIETARALVYLHASEIIHRDVKTSNILLDHNFSAKVADFGLSRLIPNDVTHVSTAPQGTPGYLDPQYHHRYQLTDKSDVYSFGVVLIELISSMVAVDLSRSQDEISLANLALNRIHRCALDQLIDPDLGSDSDAETMRMMTSVAELAFQCLQFYSEMRPTMNEVLVELEEIQSQGRIEADGSRIKELENVNAPAPSETSDKAVLLKDFLRSPVSVTGEWHSNSTGSTTPIVR